MGVIAMVLGVSGTGKTASLRNFGKDSIALVNVTGKPLPFKGKFDEVLVSDDYRRIKNFIRDTEKGSVVLDDVQYLMGNEFMRRITEKGWDRFNEIAFSFNDLLDFIAYDLPEDKIVYLLGHTERDSDGNEKFKTMGKAIDSCICVEGKVFIVLKTCVTDGKYCFLTQNSGHDTTKSPIGMFPSYAIDNDLKYVDEKIRNYYEIGEHRTDAEMAARDREVAGGMEKPDAGGRRARKPRAQGEPDAPDAGKGDAGAACPSAEHPDDSFMDIPEGAGEEMPFGDLPEQPERAPRQRKAREIRPTGEAQPQDPDATAPAAETAGTGRRARRTR